MVLFWRLQSRKDLSSRRKGINNLSSGQTLSLTGHSRRLRTWIKQALPDGEIPPSLITYPSTVCRLQEPIRISPSLLNHRPSDSGLLTFKQPHQPPTRTSSHLTQMQAIMGEQRRDFTPNNWMAGNKVEGNVGCPLCISSSVGTNQLCIAIVPRVNR